MTATIPYTRPSITELEIRYASDAAANGWGEQCYAYIEEFENRFKSYVGTGYAIATSSCTGALHIGLAALGIGPGDEVIMADSNWIASAAPITYLGAKPVFVDILSDTWCLDPERVEAAITDRTRAILAVHLYGNLCDMDRLLATGEKYDLPVIEDAAEALGSCWRESHAGTLGKFGVFSFHGSKTLTTGEGGMFITGDESLYEKVLTLSNHGRSRTSRQFRPETIGYKYKMSNIQAAIGCAQMERADDLIKRKREVFQYYSNRFRKFDGIKMNPEPPGTVNGYWMPTIVFDKELRISRDTIIDALKCKDIDARIFFDPLSSMDMFEKISGNAVAYDICKRALNLPSYNDLGADDMDRISNIILKKIDK